MIKIRRTPCPAILLGKTPEGTHYNKTEVVSALWAMQHGKCCYCERRLPETGHLKAVEHFRPKSVFPELRNEWRNLLLACSQCNGQKADKFPEIPSDPSKGLMASQRPYAGLARAFARIKGLENPPIGVRIPKD